ncbi:DBH-like monooxygenase protein 1 isoform X2 [Tubulanus polymorphus]|uniref:DBH-like monooxygenase protein 1 isoform X2 n=1 Tax=Tubulanus polymorphus TaxID=672921 RepID=UPI003DA6865A
MRSLLISAISLAIALAFFQDANCQIIFPNKVFLDGDAKKYSLEWRYDQSDEPRKRFLTFKVTVETTGYVGFGLSPTGSMKGSDMVIGWVTKDGTPMFHDRYAPTSIGMPIIDTSQDWHLLRGAETDGKTTLVFRRNLDTCDKENDIEIQESAMRIVYSYSDTDPSDETKVHYHGHTRGTKTLYLLDKPKLTKVPPDMKTLDLVYKNYTIPSLDTTYYCAMFEIDLPTKHHAVAIDHVVQPGNERMVHHMLLYSCPKADYSSVVGRHGHCYGQEMRRYIGRCLTVVAGFAVGGETIIMPDHIGLPIGGPDETRYYLLQIHYDNPDKLSGVKDSSGMRVHYTSEMRTHDVGVMYPGITFWQKDAMIIPPKQQKFELEGWCPSNCIDKALQRSNVTEIHVITVVSHAHLLGRAVRLRHFRNGKELKPIVEDMSYDFDYQTWRWLPSKVTIKQGDSLLVECTYNTMDRTDMSRGGESTREEMCYVFFYYYPRIPLAMCSTHPNTSEAIAQTWPGRKNEIPNDATDSQMRQYQETINKVNISHLCYADDMHQYAENGRPPGDIFGV